MQLFPFDKITSHFKTGKLYLLLVFSAFFSILYMFLDDKHFKGVNAVRETIKKEVIKKKVEQKLATSVGPQETFFDFANRQPDNNAQVDNELDKATKTVKQEVSEDELSVDKIETSTFQRIFDRMYFSITTSTLLGYGDIYPVSNLSKLIVMIQSMLTVSLIVL